MGLGENVTEQKLPKYEIVIIHLEGRLLSVNNKPVCFMFLLFSSMYILFYTLFLIKADCILF